MTDLQWHRDHDRIESLPPPYPWRRMVFAILAAALCAGAGAGVVWL